jgi:hypothetical protein
VVLDDLNPTWHGFDAWPGGLSQLRQRFLLAPVSKGNIALMVALARRNGFCWDAILGASRPMRIAHGPCCADRTNGTQGPSRLTRKRRLNMAVGNLIELTDKLGASLEDTVCSNGPASARIIGFPSLGDYDLAVPQCGQVMTDSRIIVEATNVETTSPK